MPQIQRLSEADPDAVVLSKRDGAWFDVHPDASEYFRRAERDDLSTTIGADGCKDPSHYRTLVWKLSWRARVRLPLHRSVPCPLGQAGVDLHRMFTGADAERIDPDEVLTPDEASSFREFIAEYSPRVGPQG